MVRLILMLCFFSLPAISFAQDESSSVVRSGLLRAQGTISFGSFVDFDDKPIYLHGNLEYYTESTISARGDIYHYLKPNEESLLSKHHQLFAGGSYHFSSGGNFDPYVGLQPGISLTIYSDAFGKSTNYSGAYSTSVNPLISGIIGFNYYATNWFHLFMDARYVAGKHLSNLSPLSINEFRFSFGLGFNINTK